MTCEEALKKLYDVIDKEASEMDLIEVQEHLENCEHCMSRYQFEAMLKTFVTDKASVKADTHRLKANIMDNIKQESFSNRVRNNPFRFGAVAVSAVAALIICIVAAFTVAEFYRHKTYTYQFEKTHMNATVNSIAAEQAVNYLENDLHLAMDENRSPFQMAGMTYSNVLDRKYLHVHFSQGDSHISLFVGDATEFSLPDFEEAILGEITYYKHVCAECQVIYWVTGSAVGIAVSEDKSLDLTSMFPLLRAM